MNITYLIELEANIADGLAYTPIGVWLKSGKKTLVRYLPPFNVRESLVNMDVVNRLGEDLFDYLIGQSNPYSTAFRKPEETTEYKSLQEAAESILAKISTERNALLRERP